jgi:hypothetical protein
MRIDTRPVEHRARCKACGTPPMYYTNDYGSFYHVPGISRTVGSHNRFRTDTNRRKAREKRWYALGKLMRSNSVRGTAVTISKYFRKHKDNFDGFRVILSCQCGETTWFLNESFDDDIINRQLLVFWDDKFPKRRSVDANINPY